MFLLLYKCGRLSASPHFAFMLFFRPPQQMHYFAPPAWDTITTPSASLLQQWSNTSGPPWWQMSCGKVAPQPMLYGDYSLRRSACSGGRVLVTMTLMHLALLMVTRLILCRLPKNYSSTLLGDPGIPSAAAAGQR